MKQKIPVNFTETTVLAALVVKKYDKNVEAKIGKHTQSDFFCDLYWIYTTDFQKQLTFCEYLHTIL